MTSKKKTRKKTQTAATTRRKHPASSGKAGSTPAKKKDVRQRVHDLTYKALHDRRVAIGDFPKLAQALIEDAAAALNKAVPQSSRNVLRQVVDGLTDTAAAAARSTRTAVKSVAGRGSEFLRHDAARAARDLHQLESSFVSALERAGKSLRGAAKDEMDVIVRSARRAGTRIKPAVRSTLEAADGRLLELGRETAGATARAARGAISGVLQGATGLLEGVSDAMKPSKKKKKKKKKTSAARTTAGKKRGRKKRARAQRA